MPEHTGATLGADLHRLLIVAREKIPGVAEYYLDSNRIVATTADTDSRAFGESRVGPAWIALRDEYQAILGRTADNLNDTGRALERVVEYYSSTDEAAADKLKALLGDPGMTSPSMRTAADSPEPRMPEA